MLGFSFGLVWFGWLVVYVHGLVDGLGYPFASLFACLFVVG